MPGDRPGGLSYIAQFGMRYLWMVNPVPPAKLDALPLHSRTPIEWGRAVLADPISLLIDHAFLEKKAATNAMELLIGGRTSGPKGGLKP